ncbi:MAG: Jag N-terminal domain-containing protein [Thermodesulfobacteriota bacterium]|nr:Jag N-terminal domain-containing protein [Thermodesulfobacteriota bacterium]|tara:strand:+ start:5194 stop:5919 length:726 start_codon:yes stop_codon:yes gene_type:complete
MSTEKEFEGKTITDATIEACKELGITRDELEFDVVEEGSTGVLGIGGRNAVIKVKISDDYTNQTATDSTKEERTDEVKEASATNVDIDKGEIEDIFKKIVNHFVEENNISSELNENNILLKMNSEADLGFLIGKKGDMIKNLEFLLSRIASKKNSQSVMVSIDINGFREKKDAQLKEKVKSLIDKVISINRPLSLNPMNSYERRICYLVIEENSEVTYKTKEQGHLKKITILPKNMNTNLS